jgi:predicted amidohydrolase YtcJ
MRKWLLCALLLIPVRAGAADCGGADLVVRNAHIVTMDAHRNSVEAMAIRDGKIVATGTDSQIASCAGPRAEILDLHGQTVLPGLIDIHTHATFWAKLKLLGVLDLGPPGVKSIADIVSQLRDRIAKAVPGEWIFGNGWDDAKLAEHRFPTRDDLDAVSPRNPVILDHVSGHVAVANSAALALAGFTDQSPNPQGGFLEKNSKGRLTGIVKDRAIDTITDLLPPQPPGLSVLAANLVSDTAASVGLTSIHDIDVTPAEMAGYQDAYRKGTMKIRVQMAPMIQKVSEAEALAAVGLHTGFGDEHVKLGAAKFFADGGMGARSIAIYPPPVKGEPNNFGYLVWKSDELHQAYRILAAAGWQLETHAVGDRAVDQVLDQYAAVMQELHLEDPRFRIVHCGICTPAIQKRLHDLHVLVDSNPPLVYWIGSWFDKFGADRVRWAFPAKSYFDNGIIAGAGSDVPVSPISPWWGIWAAVARK